LQRYFNACPLACFAYATQVCITGAMKHDELVYALAVRPAAPGQRWHARLVAADGGQVNEFDTLADLIHYLARSSLLAPTAPPTGVR
jgi:hypothetical protein